MTILFKDETVETDDFKIEEDSNGDFVLTLKSTGATFKHNGNAWVPADNVDMGGDDVKNAGAIESDEILVKDTK